MAVPNPLARWQFETGEGNIVFDNASNQYNGSLQNGVVWSTDVAKGGFALQLDGVDDFVRVPHYDALTFGNSAEFALTLWVKTTATTDSELISKRAGGNAYPYNVRLLANGQVQFTRFDGLSLATITSSATVNDGAYHFIAAVKQENELKIYIDGTLSGTATDTTTANTINSETLRFGFGDSLTPLPFNGLLDDTRIYNAPLCDSDVIAIMNQP